MTPLYHDNRNRLGNSSIALLIVLSAGLIIAVFVGLSIGQGDLKKTYIMMVALGAFPIFLILGSNYWVLLPFALTVSLPAIPLVAGRVVSFGELWVLCAVGAFVLRFPFAKERVQVFRWDYVPMMLYVGWAAMIWKANGTGLAILGASSVGGRSYVKIALAAAAFLILCNQRMEDRHAKWIAYGLILSGVVSSIWGAASFYFAPSTVDEVEVGFYTWHQFLSRTPYYALAYIFARYSLPDLISNFRVGLLMFIATCYGMVIFSGKRAALAVCLAYPLMSAIIRKQYAFVFAGAAAVAMALIILVAGHGTVYRLPMTVQRALWILPGDWDYEVRAQTEGSFRRTLNRLAMDEIRANPIIGRGFGFTSLDATLAMTPQLMYTIARKGDHMAAFIMAASGEWHSTWLGTAATLGIPAAVFWAFIWVQLLWNSSHVYRRAPPGSHMKVMALMILMLTIAAIMRSWTSGHAAGNLLGASWELGVILSAKYSLRHAEARAVELSPRPLGAEAMRRGLPQANRQTS